MIKTLNSKVVFFFLLLISLASAYNAQTIPGDTLKKISADTLDAPDDGQNLESKITYSAEDSVVYLGPQSKVILYGKAAVKYEGMDLKAEFIEIDYLKNLMTAYGKKDSLGKDIGLPEFDDGQQKMRAKKIMYNLKTKRGKIYEALTNQGELLVIGSEIKKDSTNIIYMKDMKCIPCKDEDARTVFRATRAKIIPDDKIVTGPMYLEIGGVPTPLALPFGFFPNTKKQKNGILIPLVGYSPVQGFFLQNGGFYWGINEKTDMTIYGDVYSQGSFGLRTVNNYNVLYKAQGSVNLGYKSFNFGDRDVPRSFYNEKSYSVGWLHTQDNKSNPSVRFSANVNFVNNQRINRINAANTGDFLNNTFQSNVNFTKTWRLSSLSLNAMHSQNTNMHYAEITFPSLTYNVNRFFPFKRENALKQNVFDKIGMNYLLEARNTMAGADSTLFSGNLENKMKYGIKHSLPISTNFNLLKYITVTPGINLSAMMYTKTSEKTFVTDSVRAGIVKTNYRNGFEAGYDANFSTALNTKVFFDYTPLFKRSRIEKIRHLMIPTLTYLYRPDFSDPQFGFYRDVQYDTLQNTRKYSIFENTVFGGPAAGKQNALSINLSNNLEAKTRIKTDTGFVYTKHTLIQNLSLNTAYNFAADSFNMADIAITGRTKLFKYFDLIASSAFDPYDYDKELGRRVNTFLIESSQQPARFKSANFTITSGLGSSMLEGIKKKNNPTVTNGVEQGAPNNTVTSDKLAWNFFVSYGLMLTPDRKDKVQPSQSLTFSGDITPTKYWKIGVSSGYDFTYQRLSYTSLNLYRDLKCWEARIDWVPFGSNKSYRVVINLKSSMLRDFKIPRQSPPINNF